jgi:hypothetical protein
MITLSYCSRSTDNFLSLPSEFSQNPDFQAEVAKLNPDLILHLPFNLKVLTSIVEFHPNVIAPFQRSETKHTMSKNEVIEIFKANPETFYNFNETNRKLIPREIILQGLELNGSFFKLLPKEYQEDKEMCLAAISNFPEALAFCGNKIKNDSEFIREFVSHHPRLLPLVTYDDEMALEAVKSNGMVILKLPKELQENPKFVMEAVKNDGEVLGHFSTIFMINHPDILKEAIKNCGSVILKLPENVKTQELCLLALKQGVDVMQGIPKKFINNDILRESIKYNGTILRYATHLQEDKEMVFHAVKNFGKAIMYADQMLVQDNPDLVFESLKTFHSAVHYAGDKFTNDKKLMTKAVSMDGVSLKYASESLQKDKEFVISAIKNNGKAFHYAHYTLKEDEDVLFEFSKNPDVLGLLNAAKYISKEKKLILEVVKKTRQILKFCDIKYLIDQEIRWAEKKYYISIRKVPCENILFKFY